MASPARAGNSGEEDTPSQTPALVEMVDNRNDSGTGAAGLGSQWSVSSDVCLCRIAGLGEGCHSAIAAIRFSAGEAVGAANYQEQL